MARDKSFRGLQTKGAAPGPPVMVPVNLALIVPAVPALESSLSSAAKLLVEVRGVWWFGARLTRICYLRSVTLPL